MLECIKKTVIGLSDTECDCWENTSGVDYTTSDSGLFITDLIDINDLSVLKDCNSQEIWQLLAKVRDFGLSKFNSNMDRIVAKNFKSAVSNCTFRNRMYQTSYQSTNHTGSYGWKGVEITSHNQKGSIARIEKIVSYFKEAGVTTVYLYSNADLTTPIKSIDLTTIDGKVINNIDDIVLDLYRPCDTCDDLKYYFIYEALLDNNDNKCFCGCSGGKCYKKFVDFKGVYFTDLAQFQAGEIEKTDNYCNGLEFYIDFECDYKRELCEDESPNYEGGLHRAYAEAIQYESVLYLLTLVDSKMSLQQIFGYSPSFESKIEGYLTETYSYIIDMLKQKNFNCITCKGSVRHT